MNRNFIKIKSGLLKILFLAIGWGIAGAVFVINDYMSVAHFIKDLGIAIAECKRINLDLPGLNLSMELYEKTRDLGYGKLGTQALFLALKEISEN